MKALDIVRRSTARIARKHLRAEPGV